MKRRQRTRAQLKEAENRQRFWQESVKAGMTAGNSRRLAQRQATAALAKQLSVSERRVQQLRKEYLEKMEPVLRAAEGTARDILAASGTAWEAPFADVKAHLHADEIEALEKLRPFRTRQWVLDVLRSEIAARGRVVELEARVEEIEIEKRSLEVKLRDAEIALRAANVPGWNR